LQLHELFLLYRACTHELSTQLKIAAASQGADVDFEEDWYDPEASAQKRVMQPHDMVQFAGMGLSLGYETTQ
jgi:hypothetical protein